MNTVSLNSEVIHDGTMSIVALGKGQIFSFNGVYCMKTDESSFIYLGTGYISNDISQKILVSEVFSVGMRITIEQGGR